MFDNKIVTAANSIDSTIPTDNKTKMLKMIFSLREVFVGKSYSIKTGDGKYEVNELKKKADDKQPELKKMPWDLDKEKEPKSEENVTERVKLRYSRQLKFLVDYQFL